MQENINNKNIVIKDNLISSDNLAHVNKVKLYLDNNNDPFAIYDTPANIEIDTTKIADGEHVLRLESTDIYGKTGVKNIPFTVRNGPAILVKGLKNNDIVEGNMSLIVHTYSNSNDKKWQPVQSEAPMPIPAIIGVIIFFIAVWALYYVISYWNPNGQFSTSPTYQSPQELNEKINNPSASPSNSVSNSSSEQSTKQENTKSSANPKSTEKDKK